MGSASSPSRRKLTPCAAGALRPSFACRWRSGLPAPLSVVRPPAAGRVAPANAGGRLPLGSRAADGRLRRVRAGQAGRRRLASRLPPLSRPSGLGRA